MHWICDSAASASCEFDKADCHQSMLVAGAVLSTIFSMVWDVKPGRSWTKRWDHCLLGRTS